MQKLDKLAEYLIAKLAEPLADKVAEKLASGKRYLSPAQYALSRSVGKRTVDRALANGKLPYKRVGRRVLIAIDADIAV